MYSFYGGKLMFRCFDQCNVTEIECNYLLKNPKLPIYKISYAKPQKI